MANVKKFNPANLPDKTDFVIDDGTKEIILKNRFGTEICKLHIRAGDVSIVDRFMAMRDSFADILKPLSDVSISSDGEATLEQDWAKIKRVEAAAKAKINELFDMDEADNIFEKRSPFSSINGKFFIEIVLDALGSIIQQQINREAELSMQRTKKHLTDMPN